MKKKFTLLLVLLMSLLIFSSCGKQEETPVMENNFYYGDTKWGMALDEVIALKGSPTTRSDEKNNELSENELSDEKLTDEELTDEQLTDEQLTDEQLTDEQLTDEQSPEKSSDEEKQLIDLYYADKTVFDKYTATEQYLFDIDDKLEGVAAIIELEKLTENADDLDEINIVARETYNDLKSILTGLHGEPAAEYTAYREGDEFKTDEELNFDKENAVIFTSRWDGDNYRFIYIVYFINAATIDVKYIAHDKETVEKVDQQEKETTAE